MAKTAAENLGNGLIVYTNGSLIKDGVGASAVPVRNRAPAQALKYHLGPADSHTVYEAELTGILLAMKLI